MPDRGLGPVEAHEPIEYYSRMASITEMERAVEQFSPDELRLFRQWFSERDAANWDAQFEADVAAGRLDKLGEEALADLRERRCTEL